MIKSGIVRRSILVWLGLVLAHLSAYAQADRLKFSHLDINNGLSHNQVNCFLRDSKGFMWIGTMSGLNRFDGYSFKVFRNSVADTASITDNYINKLFEDPVGRIWVSTNYGVCVYNPMTEKFSRNTTPFLREFGLPVGVLTDIQKNRDGLYWFIHQTEGLFNYDPVNKKTTHVIGNEQGAISSITEDSQGNVWVVYSSGLFEKLDAKQYAVAYRNEELQLRYARESYTYSIKLDLDDDPWIGITNSNKGIFYFNSKTKSLQQINQYSSGLRLNNDIVHGLEVGPDGLVWVAIDHGGINIIDKKKSVVTYILNDPSDESSLVQNSINAVYRDQEDIMWIGTPRKGVNYYHPDINKFTLYNNHPSEPGSLPYDDINRFVEDEKGNIWMGSNGGGLIYFDRSKNTFTQYVNDPNDPNSLSSNVIVSLCIDHAGKLWIGTYWGGLDCFDGKRFIHYKHNPRDSTSISDDNAWEIMEDRDHNLWIGTLAGFLNKLDPQRKTFTRYGRNEGVFTNYVPALMQDNTGDIWVGTGYGLTILHHTDNRYQHILGNGGPGSLSNNNIMALHEDSRGLIWIGTQDGLNVYNRNSRRFRAFRVKDGLPANSILHILEDNSGNIWVSTPAGISAVIIDGDLNQDSYVPTFRNYEESDGLQGKQFNENAGLKTSKDEFIFGGANGFNIFKPEEIRINKTIPAVVITDFQIHNASVNPGDEVDGRVVLTRSISETETVTLKHAENVFSVEFTALSYFHPHKNQYRYKLEGFNEDWTDTDSRARRVTYTNLDPGEYVFRVQASNSDGYWNEEGTSLKIVVLPPFWKSRPAIAVYIIIILSALALTRYVILTRERMKYKLEQERAEASRVHELDLMKIRFFTNVSHEFRTPLTLILSPLEKLIKKATESGDKDQLLLMHRNAKRLLNLVNQLLDFRRMEVQEIKLNPSEGNIVKLIEEIVYSFSDLSEKKNIRLSFASNVSSLETIFDQNKIERILFNLISNAFKFTPEGGEVKVQLNVISPEAVSSDGQAPRWLEIKVRDTGIGIPYETQERIFDRFFQNDLPASMVNQGSGIGLSIAREFVKIHGGTITVESEPEKGSCFTVRLPVRELSEIVAQAGQEEIVSINNGVTVSATEQGVRADKRKPVLLLVEDNEDFRFYLKDNLKLKYQILESRNGKEAWQVILQTVPDLIVSDVMMPEMDGMELCRLVKRDQRTSHIPVILLTARSAEEQRVEGYETGADDYVTKPFSFEILQARIKNLIALRASFHRSFSKTIEVKASEIKISSLDEKLIEKAIKLVEENISNPDFSVENLSHELGMSRVHLYKKLLSLTGKSPIEFIRTIRLQRAAQLLEKSQLTVAEVAYKVGFNNPKYFTRYFKDHFNVLPSAYAKKS